MMSTMNFLLLLGIVQLSVSQVQFRQDLPITPYQAVQTNANTLSDAITFLREFDREAAEMCNRVANAEWKFSTNATEYNKRRMREQQSLAAKFECLSWKRAAMFDTSRILDSNTRRQLGRIITQGRCGLGDELYKEITHLVSVMKDNYNNIKLCPYQGQTYNLYAARANYVTTSVGFCDLKLDPDLLKIMEQSRVEPELKYVWSAWRDRSGPPIKNTFMRYLDLANRAAQRQGFNDAGEQMRAQYEDSEFFFTVQELWTRIQPLYRKLFTFVRKGLVRYHGTDIVRRDGPIPAHLLGNMWAQNWQPIKSLVHREPIQTPDVSANMIRQNYTPQKIFQVAEEFFTSMGLPPMSPEFWRNSLLQKPHDSSVHYCTASAWDFCNGVDFRIKQCTKVGLEDFINAHHEMTHIHYYMQYSSNSKPFVYREGPNPAFHEAVASAVSLCVGGPVHLQRIGLLQSPISAITGNSIINIEYLLSVALDKLPFMAFSIALEKWRWYVFEKGPSNMNARYWELKLRYQGVIPPIPRTNDHFDPGAKYHIISDQDYIKYFVATVLQFQIFAEVCQVANQRNAALHTCDFSRSREAGRLLSDIMQQGASLPSGQLIKLLTRGKTARLSADALLEFFRPLEVWLDGQIQGEPIVGWNSNLEDVALFQSLRGSANDLAAKKPKIMFTMLTIIFVLIMNS